MLIKLLYPSPRTCPGHALGRNVETYAYEARRPHPRRPHVAHPVHFFSEHGHEVTLAPDGGYDERQAEDTPRQSAWHLQGDQVLRTDPARGDRRGAPVEEASHPVGTSARIEPSLQTHRRPPELRVFSIAPNPFRGRPAGTATLATPPCHGVLRPSLGAPA